MTLDVLNISEIIDKYQITCFNPKQAPLPDSPGESASWQSQLRAPTPEVQDYRTSLFALRYVVLLATNSSAAFLRE